MSFQWNREVLEQFNHLWLCLGPVMKHDLMTSCTEDVVGRYKANAFQGIVVWARQYSHMLVESNGSKKPNEIFYPDTGANGVFGQTDALYAVGIDPQQIVRCVRRVMQLHQQAAKCAIPEVVQRREPARGYEAANCTSCNNESFSDRRERLARYCFLDACAARANDFVELVASRFTTFEVVLEQLHDGEGGAGEQTIIMMRLTGYPVSEKDVTIDAAKDEFMKTVRCPTDEVAATTVSEWRPVSIILRTLHGLEQNRRDMERAAARTFSDPSGADVAKAMLKDIAADRELYTKRLDEQYVRIGKWMVKKRLKMLAEVGYSYVGTRDERGGGWFVRTVSDQEMLSNALSSTAYVFLGTFGDFPEDPAELKKYELARGKGLRATLWNRSKRFLKFHEIVGESELSLSTSELYHYEEAVRCKSVKNASSVDLLAMEDEPRAPKHAPSLPKIDPVVIETLLSYSATMKEIKTPREKSIPYNMMERAGLQVDDYFGYTGPQRQHSIVSRDTFTSDVAHEAIKCVMNIISYAVKSNRHALRSIVTNITKVVNLQRDTRDAITAANAFIQSSSAFWKTMREGEECSAMLETVAVDDVLVVVLSHLVDTGVYMALSRTCTALNRSEALRGALPRLQTKIMTGDGCPGTINSVDGVPKVRKDMLVTFNTTFGFYKPQLDGADEWVAINVNRCGGDAPGHSSVRVELVYDSPGFPAVRSREAVLRMGKAGDKVTGEFTIANLDTPIKVLTTSSSVNPIPKTVYTDAIAHWEAVVAQQPTIYARKRLQGAKDVLERNRKQQCMRVRIIIEKAGNTMTAISEPFVSVANLTKEKTKERVKMAKESYKRQKP